MTLNVGSVGSVSVAVRTASIAAPVRTLALEPAPISIVSELSVSGTLFRSKRPLVFTVTATPG